MVEHQVTFETKCYESDWRFLLKKGRLESMMGNCHYFFSNRVLFINNVADYSTVLKAADKLVARDVITEYCVVKDHEQNVLDHFQLTKESFKGGYYYSIAELTSIWRCKTDFLLHFSGDSLLEDKPVSWIDSAIGIMMEDASVVVANPVWDRKYEEARRESFKQSTEWYYSYGFSDQCYLVRPSVFNRPIYSEHHEESKRYPVYGGELFEKRVDSWMRNNSLSRITSKYISYQHQNIPKNKIKRFIELYLK